MRGSALRESVSEAAAFVLLTSHPMAFCTSGLRRIVSRRRWLWGTGQGVLISDILHLPETRGGLTESHVQSRRETSGRTRSSRILGN